MGAGAGDGGVAHGDLLVQFCEALLGDDDELLASARSMLENAIGDAALVDTAAVAALFNAIDRIADATGIPLEDWKVRVSGDFRADLGINHFASMAHRDAYD